MNRVTVILLALVILLAHGLAIHQTVDGEFGAPYEIAHVAFRLARNLVHEGSAIWNPGGQLVESYPSPMWVGLCAVSERFYLRTGLFAQSVGIVSMLATVAVLAQFSRRRMSGLVAPLLLAASGAAAAAGTSGTEAAWMMLLVTTTFLAFERGFHRIYGLALAMAILSRPEGPWIAVYFALLHRWVYRTDRRGSWLKRHAWPLGAILLASLARQHWTGSWLSPHDRTVLAFDGERWSLGFQYLWSFFRASGSGWLVLLPLLSIPLGGLPALGFRALGAFAVWALLVASTGGDGLPLWNGLAPVLPLLFLSVQESMTAWMDRAPRVQFVAWPLLAVAMIGSFLVSKVPGNVGPFSIESWHRAWLTPGEELAAAYGRPLGRLGLDREIREVERLRSVGPFLRSRIGQPATILTPWPGTVATMSRKRVQDLLGRTQIPPGGTNVQSWRGTPRFDVVEAFSTEPDYIVPVLEAGAERGAIGLLRSWLRRYDEVGDTEERMVELLSVLAGYEVVCAPAEFTVGEEPEPPYLVLRNKGLGLSPRLQIERRGTQLRILAHHPGPQQVVELQARLRFEDGTYRTIRPTGAITEEPALRTRTDILLYPTGTRPICLLQLELPIDDRATLLEARLVNPGSQEDAPLSTIGQTAELELR